MKPPAIPPEDVMLGMQLTPDEVAVLEGTLNGDPQEAESRTRLLGYYGSLAMISSDAEAHYQRHMLWLIENAPEAPVTGSAYCRPDDEDTAAQRVQDLWRAHLARHPANPRVLVHAARFFARKDADFAQELLRRAQASDPGGNWRLDEPTREIPEEVMALLAKRADQPLPPAGTPERFYDLSDWAKKALAAGNNDEAHAYATELLEMAPRFAGDWNHGNALHHAHLILGHLALIRGDQAEAGRELLLAAEIPGSPQLMSFGPNMALAQALLERGERDVVLKYFRRCQEFWTMGRGKLDVWAKDVEAGRSPKFMANLKY